MNRPALAAIVALSALALAGCSGAPADKPKSKPQTFLVVGSVTTPIASYNRANISKGSTCSAEDGYDDISEGAQVVLKDNDGKTVSLGELESGDATADGFAARCKFSFTLRDITSEKFYSLHVGNDNRGEIEYTKSKLQDGPDLTLG